MIISHEHKFIFVKTRKTAGSSLEHLLYPYLNKEIDICTGSPRDNTPSLNVEHYGTNGHLSWKEINNSLMVDNVWDNYYKFTIERNPWDKVVSSYFWHKEIKKEQFGDIDFESYVRTCQLLPTDWQLYTDNNKVALNDVYQYDNLTQMYEDLNQLFGFNITKEQRANTKLKSGIRKVKDYKDIHTKGTINFVSKLFENEIKTFGYSYS